MNPGWLPQSILGGVTLCLAGVLLATPAVLAQEPDVGDVVRFLEQSTFGPSSALITKVRTEGFESFLSDQFTAAMNPYPELPPMPSVRPAECTGTCQRDNYTMHPLQVHFFRNAVEGQDQLRQRVAWALGQIFVVSGLDVTLSSWMRPFQQLLYQNAFGNYGQLLYEVTRNPAMGRYLDALNNRCQIRTPPDLTVCHNGSAVKPNENYAREFLQLFTVGTELLNVDGTPVLDDDGRTIPTYDQNTIEEFSRLFTGWVLAPRFDESVPNYIDPMRVSEPRHDRGPKTLLNGVGLPGNQSADQELRATIASIVAHQNTAPFVSRQLIQHLVTSNPAPSYVADISGVFAATADSPTQLREVVRAILLHPDARGNVKDAPNYGRLREPVQFIVNLLRALNGTTDGVLNSIVLPDGSQIGSSQIGQNVFTAPSVFNFYSPNHVIPRTDPPLFGPEFQIHSTTTAVRRANFVNEILFSAIPGTTIDLSKWLKVAETPDGLITACDRLLLHGTMSLQTRKLIRQAIDAIDAFDWDPLLRVRQAVYLTATSSEYQVQR